MQTSRLLSVKKLIADAEKKYGRVSGSVQLLAASKGQSVDSIAEVYQQGQRCFGENYLQEALTKITALPDTSIEWHFIGPIQSNKTRKIAEHFAWVQSVDDVIIAKRLHEQRPAHLPPLNICIQVNSSSETSKSGVSIQNVAALMNECLALPRLKLRGLMAIPAPEIEFAKQRQQFQTLFTLWQSLRDQGYELDTLSMGMSADFEAAIAEGSTLVRIGTAIFGERV